MRILFLNYEYPPIGGGGANATHHLFREFAKRPEILVDCVTSAWQTGDCEEQLADNLRLIRLAVGKRERHYWTQREVMTWLLRSQRVAADLCRRHNYNLCHAFFGFPSGMVSWLLRNRLPYMVSLRGSDVPGFNPRFSFQYRVLKPVFRRIWREAGAVVANSVGLQRLANQFMPDLPIRVIPNGVDMDMFRLRQSDENIPGRMLCVSRLVGRKGVQHLVAAMPRVVAEVPDAHLVIVGEGDLLAELQRQCRHLGVEDRVDFRGYMAQEQLPELYRSARLLIQPSYYEGMSNTVLEAMASGLPILATGEGGREELLQDNALVTSYADPEKLAEGAINLLQNPHKLAKMGMRSRQIAEQFSWGRVADQYLDIYEVLQKSRSASRVSRPEG